MVSIIITCYENDRKFISNAIDSCLSQDVPIEIIVVDGGSRTIISNNSVLKADKYIYTRQNDMQAGAMNLGIKNAKYDLILGLDSDDWLYDNVLGDMVRAIDGVDVVCGCMTKEAGGKALVPMEVNRENLLICNPIFWSSLFRKSVCGRAGGMDKVVYQDYRFWVKLFLGGCRFKNIDTVIYNHGKRPNSRTDKEFNRVEELNKEAKQPLYEDNNLGI